MHTPELGRQHLNALFLPLQQQLNNDEAHVSRLEHRTAVSIWYYIGREMKRLVRWGIPLPAHTLQWCVHLNASLNGHIEKHAQWYVATQWESIELAQHNAVHAAAHFGWPS